ncbi:AraC family transcriptional regulator [Halomonas sp. DP5N14-9]|uniref:helix-turn-helix transcriptional regulator n=1 Tax=Halomonas sp. DP5N14-9 TaxID=2859075 RepID=UPI001C98FF1A|nr:AraC family transcriptional regulator [Halomonas sp. DP5N14-9]MBY5943175.1 AraC family transcriptional regulator [Halomonas sp. DP5N14-9]
MSAHAPLIEHRHYPDRVLSDRHDFQQLLLGRGGMVELDVGGRGLRVGPGVLAPVPSGETHHYLAPGANDILVLDLPVAWCQALGVEGIFENERARGYRAPASLVEAAPAPGAGVEALARWLSRLQHALDEGRGRPLPAPRLRLLQLLPRLRGELAHPWRVKEMAALCHLSEAVFARQFRELLGVPPAVWLRRERLALARQLLVARTRSGSAMALSEVALVCGFHDAAHFSRVFREAHDVSPGAWRRQAATATHNRSESYKT